MKTKKLILTTIISLISIGIYAQNSVRTAKIENERSREYHTYDKKSKITWKTEYKYDDLGNRIRQISYKQNKGSEWIPIQMHEYQYDSANKIANIVYTKWDKRARRWNNESEMLVYLYNNTERYMVVKRNTSRD
ncbi:MAG: DUF3836 domain-containing protein [Prevotella sp.]|jgi:hypothetical protein|nr:DUF3836 domain-containing protein [Prevotella sp.]